MELRHLGSLAEFEECVALQRETWGADFSDIVPASILKITQKVGGLVAGAFDGDRLVGFVYSIVGYGNAGLIHWSHMLAVSPSARGRGLGRRLKLFQRTALLKRGVARVFWTFDPLIAQNAHLNLNRLGASIAGYVPNMYGEETGSPLHGGGETDRFVVRWDLDSSRAKWAISGEVVSDRSGAVAQSELVTLPDVGESLDDIEFPETSSVRIETPCDAVALYQSDPERFAGWRYLTRSAFLHYLRRNYVVQSFHRDSATGRCFYYLKRP